MIFRQLFQSKESKSQNFCSEFEDFVLIFIIIYLFIYLFCIICNNKKDKLKKKWWVESKRIGIFSKEYLLLRNIDYRSSDCSIIL